MFYRKLTVYAEHSVTFFFGLQQIFPMFYHKLFCTHVVEKYSSVYSTFQYTLSSVIKTSCMFCMDTLHNSLKSAGISPAKYFLIFSTNKHLKYTVQIIYQNLLFLISFSHSKLFFPICLIRKRDSYFFFKEPL